MNPNDPRQPNKPFRSGDQIVMEGKRWHVCGVIYQYGQRCLDLVEIIPDALKQYRLIDHRVIPYVDVLTKIIHEELTNPENMS